MRRVPRVFTLLPLLLSWGCGAGPWTTPEEVESVVLISIDTLRADHLGLYGYTRETSPFLDEVAFAGAVFDQAVSSSPWTLPSHATMLTGLEPSTHRAVDAESAISASATLAAELFREAGHATAGFVTAWFVSERYGFDRGFDTFSDLSRSSRRPRQKVRAGQVIDAGLNWVDGLGEEPFFLFLHLYDVHYDYDPPAEIQQIFDTGYEGKRRRYQSYKYHRKHPLKPQRLAYEVAMYDGEIRYVDGELERFWRELDALGRRSGTLFVITSDHGEEFYEHGSWGHAHTLFEEQVRVPLILAGAGIPEGERISTQVRLVDLLPTLVELAGLRLPEDLAGRSFLSLLRGDEDPGASHDDRPALLETSRFDTSQIGLRWRGHKLITDLVTGEDRLHDLRRDAGEVLDLAIEPRSSDVLEGMRRRLRTATLEAVTDRWRVTWRPAGAQGGLVGRLRTEGRFLAAVDPSGAALEIADGGRVIDFDLASGEGLEFVVLPIDAEISLEEIRGDSDGPASVVLGGAEPVTLSEPLVFSATSLLPVKDGQPDRSGLIVRLEQEHLVAASVALDDEARRRLEALGYLVD